MQLYQNIYEPSDDSFMLAKILPRYVRGKVLDIGTGSGILAETTAKVQKVKEVLATDINPHALKYVESLDLKTRPYRKKIKTRKSDLFSKIEDKFDVIIFNPPYLPEDKRLPKDYLDKAETGGKHGWEIIARFFDKVENHLEKKGTILLLFSSLTNKNKVDELIKNKLFEFKEIKQKQIFHETLYIYKIVRNKLREELEKKRCSQIIRYAHGKRGVVYKALFKGNDVAIKVEKKGSKYIKNEVIWLKKLNKHDIGPKFIFSSPSYVMMEFIEGDKIFDFMRKNDKTAIKKMLKKVFDQCFIMDKLKVNKLEMHHPHKHIIVKKDTTPVLIDFERGTKNDSPKNVTQFVQFITSTNFQFSIVNKNFWMNPEKLRRFAAMYKNNMNEKNLDKIIKEIR